MFQFIDLAAVMLRAEDVLRKPDCRGQSVIRQNAELIETGPRSSQGTRCHQHLSNSHIPVTLDPERRSTSTATTLGHRRLMTCPMWQGTGAGKSSDSRVARQSLSAEYSARPYLEIHITPLHAHLERLHIEAANVEACS